MLTRRYLLIGSTALIASQSVVLGQDCDRFAFACQGDIRPPGQPGARGTPVQPTPAAGPGRPIPGSGVQYAPLYAAAGGEPFPVPAVDVSQIDPRYLRQSVFYASAEPAGTIVVDPQNRFLYLIQGGGRALRYGVGVGRQGFTWSGDATVKEKQAWPDWYPPKEMIEREPHINRQLSDLRGGRGMAGGPRNPLGARALYLWQGNKDTLYRIHGTFEPHTIGRSVSSGCIRMINQDVMDLYQRAQVGAKVIVLGARAGR